jgi:hypothetical protein
MFYRLVDLVHELDYVAMSRLFDDRDRYEVDSKSVWLNGNVREGEILVPDGDKKVRVRAAGDSTRTFFVADSAGEDGKMVMATVYGVCDALFYGDWVSVGSELEVLDTPYPSVFVRRAVEVGIEALPKVVVYSLVDIASEDVPLSVAEEVLIPVLIVPDDFVRVFRYHYRKVDEEIQRRLGTIYRMPYQVNEVAVKEVPEPLKVIYGSKMLSRLYARRRFYVDVPSSVVDVINEGERLFEEVMNGTVTLPLDKLVSYRDVPYVKSSVGVFTDEFFSRRRF